MLDWLIVGAGVQGCVLAHALVRYGRVHPKRLRLVDPHAEPMAAWHRRSFACGMRHLRSPAAHSIDPDFGSLLRWARANGYDPAAHTIPPYARPSVELFAAHSSATLHESGLSNLMVAGTVVGIAPLDRANAVRSSTPGWAVELAAGSVLTSRRVALATGPTAGLTIPQWTPACNAATHVFAQSFDRAAFERAASPIVVGGGISGVTLAVHWCTRSMQGALTLVTRRRLSEAQFDSDPCYIGPRCMERFAALDSARARRALLDEARHPGSSPPELLRELQRLVQAGRVRHVVDTLSACRSASAGPAALSGDSGTYHGDRVVLATGFSRARPGGELLNRLRGLHGGAIGRLPVDETDRPIPGPTLEWTTGLYLTGLLAEVELGPSAGNIIGAHNAAKRIVSSLYGDLRCVPAAWRRYESARG